MVFFLIELMILFWPEIHKLLPGLGTGVPRPVGHPTAYTTFEVQQLCQAQSSPSQAPQLSSFETIPVAGIPPTLVGSIPGPCDLLESTLIESIGNDG